MGKVEMERDVGVRTHTAPVEEAPPVSPGATLQGLIVSINELRHEISYAKYNNNDWWHSTLKRLDTQNKRVHRLTGVVIGLSWMLFLLTVAVVALSVYSGALQWPSWEHFSRLWDWAK